MNKNLPWPALIGRLRFLMDVDQAQLAGHHDARAAYTENHPRQIT